jgi:hypothetical protein
LAAVLAALVPGAAAAQNSIDFARQLYNQGRFDQAIIAATRLRVTPAIADTANLVLGRSHLERYRQTADRTDLVAGREALRDVHPSRLAPRDQVDYLVGLGETLYLDESFGAAAEVFDSTLDRSLEFGPRAFDRVFDWWATALDREAQSGMVEDREAVYMRIRDRASADLIRVTGSAAAPYWLVVAHRSLGNVSRAWDAAIAAWVRAPLTDDEGVALRADLDRYVVQAIIPERARQGALSDRDRDRAAAALKDAWDAIKKDWEGK